MSKQEIRWLIAEILSVSLRARASFAEGLLDAAPWL
jgi:hypothetical protein